MSTNRDVKEMVESLAEKKEEAAELRGQRTSILKRLKDAGCKDTKEAQKEAAREEKKVESLKEKRDALVEELQEEYEWD